MPLFGDMGIASFRYIETSPNYDESKWPHCSDHSRLSPQHDLIGQMPRLRSTHDRLMCEMMLADVDQPEGEKPEKVNN